MIYKLIAFIPSSVFLMKTSYFVVTCCTFCCISFIIDAETSLAEAVVLAQHERETEEELTEEKRDEEKRSRKSSTSSAASSHASSTSSKASSTKGYPVKEELDDDEGRPKANPTHNTNNM